MSEDPNKITYFAASNARGTSVPFGIKRRDRERHMYVIGKTGMGKSTLLENMAIQDVRNGEGVAFIDPHGGTADRIMEYVPEHRMKDVVYFAPFDMDYPIAFNVMEDVGYDKRHLVVSGLMSAFKKLWVDAWSARMEYILSNTLLALLEYEGATLLDVNAMYSNKAFRKKVVDNIKDPVVKKFWVEEYGNYTERFAAEATPAIQNKVGQFTSNPLIRNIIGQAKSSFDLREIMDQKKILIINLSKGRVGDTNTQLLGSMFVTKIYLAAMSRADVDSTTLKTLPPFYLYVDEFQNFANQSFSDILSEARKYKLNLIIAHQYIEQMEEEVRDAVFGNVGTTVCFRVGPFDAEVLETIFEPQFTQTDLVNLGFAQIYLTLMIDGVGSPPFSATTLPPFDPPPGSFVKETIAHSRAAFARPRAEIEAAITAWQEADTPKPGGSAPKPSTSSTSPKPSAPRPAAPKVVVEHVPVVSAHTLPETHAPHRVEHAAPRQATQPAHTPAPHQANHAPHAPQPAAHTNQPVVRPQSAPRPQPSAQSPVRTPAPVTPRPPAPKAVPEAPKLEGAMSLREALEKATSAKIEPAATPVPHTAQTPVSGGTHAPDLKDVLQKLSTPTKESAVHSPVQSGVTPPMSKEELQAMLSVDEHQTPQG